MPTLAIILCHTLTGTASVSTRYLISVLDPVEIAFMRYFFGGLILLPAFFFFRSPNLNRDLLFKIIVLGILFFALFPFLFSYAFVYTNVARGSLVLATMSIWAMLLSKLMGHEKFSFLSLAAIGLTLSGLFIALSDKLILSLQGSVSFKGELIMLLAAMCGAIYAVMSRSVLKQVLATTMTPIAMLAGCLFLFPFTISNGIDDHILSLSPMQMGLMIYLGIVAGGIAFFLFNWALIRTTATFNTMFVTLNPITAIFLAYLFLGEMISINFIIGVLIVFSGLGLAVYSQRQAI
jgi:drug/metabolite transporter (DMT)-like permease